MPTLTERIETLLVGNATGLVSTFREGGTAADAFAAKTTTTGRVIDKLGLQGVATGDLISKGMKVGTALAGVALAKFAFDGVQHFSDLTATVRGYQRVTGTSAEDASRLAAAVRMTGVDATAAQTGFFQLAKRIGQGKDTLDEYGAKVVKTSSGSTDMAKTIESAAAAFQKIEDPAKRDAFVMENFGKGGAALIPILSKSHEELSQFFTEAAKNHEIFTQDDLEKGRQYQLSLRELQAAAEGLGVEVGSAVIPLITSFSHILGGGIHILDDFGHALGGVNLSAAAAGAAIGLLIPGPGWLAAVGAGVGLLAGMGSQMSSLSDQTKRFATNLQNLDVEQAAKKFDQLSTIRALSDNISVASAKLQTFHDIAEQDPAAAQKIIDGLKAQGDNVDKLQSALDKIIDKKKADQAASDANTAANKTLTASIDDQATAIDALVDKDLAAQRAAQQQQDAVTKLTEARYAATFAAEGDTKANQDVADALLTAEENASKAASAARDKAEADYTGTDASEKSRLGVEAQIGSLQGLANTLSPDDPLRQFLDQYIYRLSFTVGNFNANVTLDTSQATGALADLFRQIDALPRDIAINVRADVASAITGGLQFTP